MANYCDYTPGPGMYCIYCNELELSPIHGYASPDDDRVRSAPVPTPPYPIGPGAADTDTSIAAAEDIAPKAGDIRTRVHRCLKRHYPDGLTTDECASKLGLSILTIRPRFSELKNEGKIRDSNRRRINASGKKAIVWYSAPPETLF